MIYQKNQDIYWVRKSTFTAKMDEIHKLIEEKFSNWETIYFKIEIEKESEDEFSVSLYYLNKSDRESNHLCYEQRPDWQNFADKAPCEAVNWAKEKVKYDIIT